MSKNRFVEKVETVGCIMNHIIGELHNIVFDNKEHQEPVAFFDKKRQVVEKLLNGLKDAEVNDDIKISSYIKPIFDEVYCNKSYCEKKSINESFYYVFKGKKADFNSLYNKLDVLSNKFKDILKEENYDITPEKMVTTKDFYSYKMLNLLIKITGKGYRNSPSKKVSDELFRYWEHFMDEKNLGYDKYCVFDYDQMFCVKDEFEGITTDVVIGVKLKDSVHRFAYVMTKDNEEDGRITYIMDKKYIPEDYDFVKGTTGLDEDLEKKEEDRLLQEELEELLRKENEWYEQQVACGNIVEDDDDIEDYIENLKNEELKKEEVVEVKPVEKVDKKEFVKTKVEKQVKEKSKKKRQPRSFKEMIKVVFKKIGLCFKNIGLGICKFFGSIFSKIKNIDFGGILSFNMVLILIGTLLIGMYVILESTDFIYKTMFTVTSEVIYDDYNMALSGLGVKWLKGYDHNFFTAITLGLVQLILIVIGFVVDIVLGIVFGILGLLLMVLLFLLQVAYVFVIPVAVVIFIVYRLIVGKDKPSGKVVGIICLFLSIAGCVMYFLNVISAISNNASL